MNVLVIEIIVINLITVMSINILNKLNLDDISNKLNYKYEIESYNCEYNYLFNIERQIQIDNNNNSKILITLVNDNNNCNIINDLNDLIINYDTCYILLIGKHIKFSNNFKLVTIMKI